MDLNEVKNLVNYPGERVILIENGSPTMVLLSYEDYKKLRQNTAGNAEENIFNISKANSEIPEQSQQSEKDELCLDDLPF